MINVNRRPKYLLIFTSSTFILFLTLYFGINNAVDQEIEYPKGFEVLLLPDKKQTNLPDIYYIILDEYAGTDSLEKNFGFDNIEFISALSKRGFFMPSNSYSNYPFTLLSIPSTLNMQYLNFFSEEMGIDSTNLQPIEILRENNLVIKNLKSQGYYVVSFYAGADSVPLLVDEKPCNSRSLLSGFDKRSEILCTFSEMPKIKDRISQPVFVYAHMALPHDPYVFDEYGNPVSFNHENIDTTTERKFYLQQLKFTNKKTIETIDAIIAKSESLPIIILQSDHGERIGVNWDDPTKEMVRQGLNNLNAYYLPHDGRISLYDDITPVNTFRVVFNEYLNADFELLDDRHYWVSSDKKPYDLEDVTEIIDEYR